MAKKKEVVKTIRMPKKYLNKWLKALRSGEYKQTKEGFLHDPGTGGFCCLGVLQHCIDGGVEYGKRGSYSFPSAEWLKDAGICFIADEDGFDEGSRTYYDNTPYLPSLGSTADRANDKGVSFKRIATAIEKCTETY